MRIPLPAFALLLALGCHGLLTSAQQAADTSSGTTAPYRLSVAVDEVSLTFHAADSNGQPIEDLTLNELRLLDNGKKPRQVLSFEAHRHLPIRAGILIDTSPSVLRSLPRTQWIAREYAQQLLNQRTDRAFIQGFDFESRTAVNWTSDTASLTSGIRDIAADADSRSGGTALYDAVYRACRDQFSPAAKGIGATGPTGNFILLFTDGKDNASHARLSDDIDICQRNKTAIYVFSSEPKSRLSAGQRTLDELVTQSGGRVFFDQDQPGLLNDLRIMESDLRSQYRVVYKPADLEHDGAFHRIQLKAARHAVITARSGYYAAH